MATVFFRLSLFLWLLGAILVTAQEPLFIYPEHFNNTQRDAFIYGTFPDDFAWGVATAAYQIEGAWNVSGKGPSIWDTFTHVEGNINNGDTGDVTCDSYHKYADDVQLMADLGIPYYRFSLSWSRLLPDGTLNSSNPDGLRYYNDLIDELLANDITPMVTLYHWDLPQGIEDIGGWDNEDSVQYFDEYAEYCFANFGDRVKFWITFNEPWVFIMYGYGDGSFAPGQSGGKARKVYNVAHNVIRAHAHAWHTYDDYYREEQKGLIGITLNSDNFYPFNPKVQLDVEGAERIRQFQVGWFAHAVFKNGDYPEVMKTRVAEKSEQQGYFKSRLPEFTEEEKLFNVGTSDFFGLNTYTSSAIIGTRVEAPRPASWETDLNVIPYKDRTWPTSGSSWLRPVPWGIRNLLNWVSEEYGSDTAIYITENGVSTEDVNDLNDESRTKYYMAYINEVLKAYKIDAVNVKGYVAWTLMDNFEWAAGFSERFGLHYVDFTDPDRPRTPKESTKTYSTIIQANGFFPPEPSSGNSGIANTMLVVISLMFAMNFVN